jgi:transcription antitermination factor NusG
MSDFKVGDHVRILPGVATPFVGMDGTICEIQPHDQAIGTMTRHFVVFSPGRSGPSTAWS